MVRLIVFNKQNSHYLASLFLLELCCRAARAVTGTTLRGREPLKRRLAKVATMLNLAKEMGPQYAKYTWQPLPEMAQDHFEDRIFIEQAAAHQTQCVG